MNYLKGGENQLGGSGEEERNCERYVRGDYVMMHNL
jgi:hypothetical protein